MKHTCLVFTRDHDLETATFEKANLPDLRVLVPKNEAEVLPYIETADIIYGIPYLAAPYLTKAKNLKWFQSSFAGIDALCQPHLRQDYILTNVKDTYGQPMAEYVFAYLLGLKRKVWQVREDQKNHSWNQQLSQTIAGETLTIVGTGSIGKEIAKMAKAFGMNTIGVNSKGGTVEFFDTCFSTEAFNQAVQSADYVVGVLPNTPQTTGFFNAKRFSQMKPSSVFMNIGRGVNVDEAALIESLKLNHLSAAVLDVFCTEPLPADSVLWDVPNLYITPHTSGYIDSGRIIEIFTENYYRFIKGESLQFKIDFEKGY